MKKYFAGANPLKPVLVMRHIHGILKASMYGYFYLPLVVA
jgi:hypothetical protein